MAVVWSSAPAGVYSFKNCGDGFEMLPTETSRFAVGARRSSKYSKRSRDWRRREEGRVGMVSPGGDGAIPARGVPRDPGRRSRLRSSRLANDLRNERAGGGRPRGWEDGGL